MPVARPVRSRSSIAGDAVGLVPGAIAVFGSNLGPAHIHAVARRNQYLHEAESSRRARLAGKPPSGARGLRKAVGRAIVAFGVRLHGDLPQRQSGCQVCDVLLAS